ncbi:hypothetical protein GW17_00057640 [Ensete ventricosum]|nr:hypothetical protein GW17_00057640 [Ensete ventricosum]
MVSEPSEEGAIGQATYKGSWPWPDPLQGWPTMARPPARRRLNAVRASLRPQRATASGQPCRQQGNACRGDRPSVRQLSAGKGSRRQPSPA